MTTESTLNDKIVTLIEALGLSNTKFADAISVSRPTISHIISGRNKPSIDIVQKIMSVYPELGYKWFLDEEDFDPEKLEELSKNHIETATSEESFTKSASVHLNAANISGKNVRPTMGVDITTSSTKSTPMRRVEKVIMFYSDGSVEVLSGAPQIL